MASPDSLLSDPRRRFMDRFLVLVGDRHEMTVTYGSFDAPADAVSEVNPLWLNADIIEEHTERLGRLVRTDLLDLGVRLGFVALPIHVRSAVVADLRHAEQTHRRLRLWINDDDFSVRDVPWEYIFLDEVEPGFLARHPACSIVRNCMPVGRVPGILDPVIDTTHPEGLRVLLAYADPEITGLQRIAAEALVDRLVRHFDRMSPRPDVALLRPPGPGVDADRVATRANLARELQTRRPHVVFLVAHGMLDDSTDQGAVYLEGEAPSPFDFVIASDLANLVPPTDGPAVYLLDVCWSARRGASGVGQAVARALCRPGCAVLSMQFAWPAAFDPLFWNTLVSSLSAPSPLDDCVFEAREALFDGTDSPTWGCPVLLRHGTPTPRAPQFVPRFGWQRELEALRGLVPDPDRSMIEELLRRAKNWLDIAALVRELDHLYIILAGDSDDEHVAVKTSPLWFTTLLGAPGRFEWRTPSESPFWLTVWSSGEEGDLVRRSTEGRAIDLAPGETASWPRGVPIRWEVRDGAARGPNEKSIARGLFEILEEPRAADVRDHLERAHASGGIEAVIDVLLGAHLFDELFSCVNSFLQQRRSVSERFLCHRALARAAADMQTRLTLAGFGHPEAFWAAALARRHSEASFRTVGSDRFSGGHRR